MSTPSVPPGKQTGLPTSILVHATSLIALGTSLVLIPQQIASSSPVLRLNALLGFPATGHVALGSGPLPAFHHQMMADAGIAALAVGLCYVATAGASRDLPREQNQFLYASVPVRLAVAAVTAAVLVLFPEKRDVFKVGIMLADGIGGLLLGFQLGSFSGRLRGNERKRD